MFDSFLRRFKKNLLRLSYLDTNPYLHFWQYDNMILSIMSWFAFSSSSFTFEGMESCFRFTVFRWQELVIDSHLIPIFAFLLRLLKRWKYIFVPFDGNSTGRKCIFDIWFDFQFSIYEWFHSVLYNLFTTSESPKIRIPIVQILCFDFFNDSETNNLR